MAMSDDKRMIGIVNKDGQMGFIEAKPVSETVWHLAKILFVLLLWFILFAYMENTFGAR